MQTLIDTIILRANNKSISSVHLVVGELVEFSPEIFQTLMRGTPAEGSQFHIRSVPAQLQCMACFEKYHPVDKKISCPICGSVGAKVLAGEECFIESVETDDE
jgi:hydrogenase nickel incorporation protein HypA/HybF